MGEELISVIVPVYNVEKYINRCLETIIHQTYKNLEIILIDDGTKDKSGSICEEYAKKDSRIKVIHKDNEGLGLTRNVGLENAKGKYISFLDSDDYIELDMYEKMHNALYENNVDAVLCNYKRRQKNNTFIYHCTNFKDEIYEENKVQNELLLSICGNPKYKIVVGSVCCVLYKKEIIDKYTIRFLNEREYVSEDVIFNYMYFKKCKRIQFLKDDLYIYCENEGSLTKKYNPDKVQKFKNLYNILKKEIDTNKEDYYYGLDTLYIGYMRVAIIQEVRLNPNKKMIKKNIRDLCNDELLCKILKIYDTKYMTTKQKIFTWLMKKQLINMLYIVSK